MKKRYFVLFLLIMSFFCILECHATSYTLRVKIMKDELPLRKDPGGTDGTKITDLSLYDYYELVENKLYSDINNHARCDGGWYHITYYTGVTGYVCEDDVKLVTSFSTDDVYPTTACEKELYNAGFPSSYWGGLCNLKEEHPTWSFQAIKTNLDWASAVDSESACGINYIHSSVLDKSFFDTTCTKTSPGSYVAPSQKAVAFYMDPRNFFTEKYVFQFLDQSYDASLSSKYPSAVKSIISGTSFYDYHKDNGIDTIISGITSASPIHMAVRIRNELGSGESLKNLYSGVYDGYDNVYYGYYNFYNYGVTDTCVAEKGTTYCGLEYAKKYNWNSLSNAINGGASQIASGYISVGQYTGYLQKYNVVPTDSTKRYIHQYQTNISAPMSESKIAYNTYKNNDLLGLNLIFKIPVYNNMSAVITNSSSGAVDDTSINNYSTLPISTIVTSSGYAYQSGYITGISIGTSVSDITTKIQSVSGNESVIIHDAAGNIVTSGILATGYSVTIINKSGSEKLSVIIKGDTSGDGKITVLDLLQVQKSILGTYSLSGSYYKAGDTSGDGKITALDLLQVQKNILGTYTIVQ